MFNRVFHCRWTFMILILGILAGSIFSGCISSLMSMNTSTIANKPQFQGGIPRLKSHQSQSNNDSSSLPHMEVFPSFSLMDNDPTSSIIDKTTFTPFPNHTRMALPTFQIQSQYDVVIDKISPEAMEKNATSMEFLLNFTITNGFGQGDSALTNLTIRNSSDYYDYSLVTDWLDWTNVQEDKYSLMFTVDEFMISNLNLGYYDLHIYIGVYSSGWYNSSDYITLPMKDLQVEIQNVSPSKFNNKLEYDQPFTITIDVKEHDGVGLNPVLIIPRIEENSININPNATIFSPVQGISGSLEFFNFIGTNSTPGRFIFNVSISESIAASFEDGLHNLSVSVTSKEGITTTNTYNKGFIEAEGTVLLVWLKEIVVESRNSFDWGTLTDYGKKGAEFRLNVNDSISFSYEVVKNGSVLVVEPDEHVINYQDPNKPEDPFAIITGHSSDPDGTGSITLVANEYTDYIDGYTVSFYVRGHQSSQEMRISNITIYWDKLYYQYTYQDNLRECGTSESNNTKALGVDVGELWSINLSLYYLSDDSPALSSHISYRFSETSSWQNLTDGAGGDFLDGMHSISYTTSIASVLSFECRIVNGSNIDQYSTYFVNQTDLSASFRFNITWTYLFIELIPQEEDSRLGTGSTTGIVVFAYWAHDNSNFTGYLKAKGYEPIQERELYLENGKAPWLGLLKTAPGAYKYDIRAIVDDPFGVSKFTNDTGDQPNDRIVDTYIVWDEVYFTFSKDKQTWNTSSFFTNFGENATLYCYGYHSYDNAPFQGTAVLIDLHNGQEHNITFDVNGIAPCNDLNRTDARIAVLFQVRNIISEPNWDLKKADFYYKYNYVTIVWDKIVITLVANQRYSHGTWANISVNFEYEISSGITIDPNLVNYSILLSNETTLHNISRTCLIDYSFSSTFHWYNITSILDSNTSITAHDVYFQWLDTEIGEPEEGNLTIYWIDDKDPSILDLYLVDLENGSFLIVVDVTDDSEDWQGSGIGLVTLQTYLRNQGSWEVFPQQAKNQTLPSGALQYIFRYSHNQWFNESGWDDAFQFNFGDQLLLIVNVTDLGTSIFPDNFEPNPPRTVSSGVLSITADCDPDKPQFITTDGIAINISYISMDTSNNLVNISDGDVIVTVQVQDLIWSGLNENSVQLVIIDQENTVLSNTTMLLQGGSLEERKREILTFIWEGNLPVFESYTITVTVTDNAGNQNSRTFEVQIEDKVAPRIKSIQLEITEDRKLKVMVTLEEAGLGIDYVMVNVTMVTNLFGGDTSRLYNLSRQEGGIGGELTFNSQVNYSTTFPLDLDFLEAMIMTKNINIQLIVSDRTGNEKYYGSLELDILREKLGDVETTETLQPLPIHYLPYFIFFSALFLISAIVIGIKVFSRTEGYDMRKIFTESERISREMILTQMDEFALGVTVNFFDQVQGPVPVIWEPPLLEDQQQVMLDLSDKSFSTLEFVGAEETERSGTFDFSTGSYECTALGYSFSIANPEARGGKENLTIVLLLRKEWGDNLLVFQDELLEKISKIREMIETEKSSSQVEKEARKLREFVSRLMIAFDKLYIGTDYELESMVE